MASCSLAAFRVSSRRGTIFHSSPRTVINRLSCPCIATVCPAVRRNLTVSATATNEDAASASTPQCGPSDTRVSRIVDDISNLTLLQAADLVTQLKSRLNIQDIALPTAAAAPAAAIAASEEDAEQEKPKEKTIFNVKLESFDAAAKAKVIREVKALNPTFTLVAAKGFVESLPKFLKENIPKDEAEKMKSAFEALGAVVKLE